VVGGLDAGDVDSSVEDESVVGVDVQLIAELQHDAEDLVERVLADRWRPNRQRVIRRRTGHR